MTHVRNFLRAVGAVAAATLFVAPAAAQEPLRNITDALGLTNQARDPIDYRERAPLVVPPLAGSAPLRPPMSGDAAARDPRWPVDPDLAKRRAAAEEARRPVARSSDVYDPRQGAVLSNADIRNGKKPRPGSGSATPDGSSGDRPSIILDRNVLNVRNDPQEAATLPGEEPRRRYLTDPPKGLRAPSSAAALGATKDRTFTPDVREEQQLIERKARGLE